MSSEDLRVTGELNSTKGVGAQEPGPAQPSPPQTSSAQTPCQEMCNVNIKLKTCLTYFSDKGTKQQSRTFFIQKKELAFNLTYNSISGSQY